MSNPAQMPITQTCWRDVNSGEVLVCGGYTSLQTTNK